MNPSQTTLKRNIRTTLFVITGVVLSGLAVKHTAVSLARPAIEEIAERATCRAVWGRMSQDELELIDPACATLLKE